jgi:hypothetical protein
MLRARICTAALLLGFSAAPMFAKKASAASATELAQISDRGRSLYEYDESAWHATDAVKATNPRDEEVGRYIARKMDAGWVVAFGHLNEARDAFLIAYMATQAKTLQDFSVEHYATPLADTGFYLSAAHALDVAQKDFHGEKRPYNIAILPATGGQFYVYILSAQTNDGVYPLGGDVRYLISPDGSTIVENRRLHNDILVFDTRSKNGSKMQAGWHTHVLSDVPEDTDVFYVLTGKPSIPEYIGTHEKIIYVVREDGTILVGK